MTAPALPTPGDGIDRIIHSLPDDSPVIQYVRAIEALPQGSAVIDNFGTIWLKTTESNTVKGWMEEIGYTTVEACLEEWHLFEPESTVEELKARLYNSHEPAKLTNAFGEWDNSFGFVDQYCVGDIRAMYRSQPMPLMELYKQFKDD